MSTIYDIYGKVVKYVNSNNISKNDVIDTKLVSALLHVKTKEVGDDYITEYDICQACILCIKYSNKIDTPLINEYIERILNIVTNNTRIMEKINECYTYLNNVISKSSVQVCFDSKADLALVKSQLQTLVEKLPKYTVFYHCFLPRHVVEKENLSTEIVDLLDEVLGDKQLCILSGCNSLSEVSQSIEMYRQYVAVRVSKTYVLGTSLVDGIKREININSNGKIVIL